MKSINRSLIWIALFCLSAGFQTSVFGQDDLYYEQPAKPAVSSYIVEDNEPGNVTRRYTDSDEYAEDDDYAYEYSSRIRRFHRTTTVVDYYDPFYVDLYYYDPYFLPGASIYTYGYNDYWTWRRWRRWNRWNSWAFVDYGWGGFNYGWNNWGWGSYYGNWGYNSWCSPFVYNNYFYDPYWTWNGYNPYYNNYWVNNHYYFDNGSNTGNYKPQTYTGARRHGTNYSPGYARINGNDRLATGKTNTPSIDLKSRPNGRSPIGTAPVPGASDRSDAGRNPASGTPGVNGRNPTDAPKFNGRDQVNTRPNTRDADISRRIQDGQGDDNRSGRDSRDFNTERRNTSIPRDNTPTRRTEPSTIERPARSGSQETTPSRRFDNGSSGRNNDTPRPSQSFRNNDGNSSGRSIDFGGSSGRSSGSSGGHSSGGSSGGGGGRSGGGGGGGGRSGGGGRH